VEVEIADCKKGGVACEGRGSRVIIQGGRITGCKELHGVLCEDGGQAEVRDVVTRECSNFGLCCITGSTLRHSGCTVSGCGLESRDNC